MRPLYACVDENGETQRVAGAELDLEEVDSIDLSLQELPSGDYEVGFLVQDLNGQWQIEAVPVRLGLAE